MIDMKNFVMSEIDKTIKRETMKKRIKEASKDLFDAVNASNEVLSENVSENKKKLANSLVLVAENKLREAYYDLDKEDGCDCEEGEGEMFKAQLLSIITNAQKLYHMVDDEDQFEDWIQSKITIAEDYLRAAYGYLTYYNGGEDAENDWGEEEDWDDVNEEEMEWEHEMEDESPSVRKYQNESLDPDIDDDSLFSEKH